MATAEMGSILDVTNYLPHGYCISWSPQLLLTYVVSDLLIFVSYFSMPAALLYFARQRKDFPYRWLLWLFSGFILACGTTHLMGVIVLWKPLYVIDAILKAVTALISLITAILLWPLVPHAIKLPSLDLLQQTNDALRIEITERKKAEEALRKERDFTRELINALPGTFYLISHKGRFQLWNKKLEELSGRTPEEVATASPADFFQGEERVTIIERVREVFLHGHSVAEASLVAKDGTVMPHYFVGRRIELDGFPYLIGMGLDISARKQMENALREAKGRAEVTALDLKEREEHLGSILDTALDAIISIDATGHILEFNKAAERIFGFKRAEVLGLNISETIIPIEQRESHRRGMARYLATGEQRVINQRIELEAVEKGGRRIPVELAITAIDRASSTVFTAFLRDISERKQAEKTIREAKEAAEAAAKAKGEFLAVMSHEIRTPMNVVLGMSDVLLETKLDAEQHRIVQTMQRSGKALMGVISDVLDFSRIESGQFTVSELPFSPLHVVEETARLMRMVAEEKGLSLSAELVPALPEMVLGDDGRLRQVLINLIGNAIKFTQLGQVTVRLAPYPEEPNSLLFSVNDTGIGIAPEHINRIFEQFTQADSGITRRYGGTGLGLAISQRLVSLMGGRLWVESQLGKGSTFFFTLPVRPVASQEQTTTAKEQAVAASSRTLRILIAEDSPDNQALFQIYLSKTPHHVVMVNDGLEAIAQVMENTFDLLLTDIEMPNMDGYAATQAIRQWEREEGRQPLTIMALSAHAGIDKRGESLAAGCDGHLTKPIKKQTLLDAIQRVAEAIDKQDLLDALRPVQKRENGIRQ
ncbi:MAG: PAS domain S-box protein [Magnetococcales bacterium]|nr:PAS domain S-box protein [Magnetococcales bacterium]